MEGGEVLNRISKIWGIPAARLQPEIFYSKKKDRTDGMYESELHKIRLSQGVSRIVLEHEKTHAAHYLIMPEHERTGSSRGRRIISAASTGFGGNPKIVRKAIKEETIADLSDKPGQKNTTTVAYKTGYTSGSLASLALTLGFAPSILKPPLAYWIGIRIAARTVEFLLSRKPVQNIYANHGIDGIILFMANPPKVFGAIETRLWNRRMVKEGLLKPNGGLTEKGELLLRYRLPKQLIIERIEEAEKNRQHETARKAVP
ncbi:MAG TPA: hypothetical protein HA227_02620 [Candidatus Diapherotrites archaeon]|uniref:Uncharacterized protein n=1 Tax=Candidatus Iainarchaeum sp. TaxID=3101447 RepID=A0A7J4KTW4_9ARCH|nr:hypothetical protein [Candidatus Diapherotrites archaeon]